MALCSVLQGLPVQVFRELVHELSEYDTVPINLAGSPRELVDAAIENVDQDQNGFVDIPEAQKGFGLMSYCCGGDCPHVSNYGMTDQLFPLDATGGGQSRAMVTQPLAGRLAAPIAGGSSS